MNDPLEDAIVWLVGGGPEDIEAAARALVRCRDLRVFAGTQGVAAELAKGAAPDLLVVDWALADGAAACLCWRVRDTWDEGALPILAITDRESPADVVKGVAAGANDVVERPLGAAVLAARMASLLRLRRLHTTLQQEREERDEGDAIRRFRAFANQLPLMMWRARTDGQMQYGNQPWLAYTLGEAIAPTKWLFDWTRFVHPDDEPAAMSRWKACLASGQECEIEVRLRRHDGVFRWHVVRASSNRKPDKSIWGWFGTCHDVDDLKRAEQKAAEANRIKDEFLAMVSHELRTPLQAILGWTRMLSTANLDEARRGRAIAVITRNADAQAKLIDDLLDVSRITAGTIRIDHVRVDLAPVVEAALETVRPAAEAKGLRLERSLEPGPSVVLGDPDRLRQIVSNLLTNAVKFTGGGGKVRAKLCRSGLFAELCVEDSGQGIRPELLPRVFDAFWQADGSATRRHGGLGLGLAITRHLVEAHGGRIVASSAGEGCGATFAVVLPLARAAEAVPRVPEGTPPARPDALDGLKVVVVDDEQDSREILQAVLASYQADVASAASAGEGFEVVRRLRPDLLVSDVAMPGEDGLSLIRRVRALPPEEGGRIPAMAVSAHARAEDRARALEAGFDLHLGKPVDPAALVAAVGRLTGRAVRRDTARP